MMKTFSRMLTIVAISVFFCALFIVRTEAQSYLKASAKDIQWWKDARFGMFVHWGPVSLKGTEIGWSRGGERRGRSGTGNIPVEVYDNLYKEFNPTEFDAVECIAALSHVEAPSLLHEFCRVVRPGGYVVFSQREGVYYERNYGNVLRAIE